MPDTFATPCTVGHQAPLFMKFSRQEYWSGLPFPPPGDLPHPGIEPASAALQTDSSPLCQGPLCDYHLTKSSQAARDARTEQQSKGSTQQHQPQQRTKALKGKYRDSPDSPVVKTSPSNAGGAGSIPSQGAKNPYALWPRNQNIKQKRYCNKFNKDFKKWSTAKNK